MADPAKINGVTNLQNGGFGGKGPEIWKFLALGLEGGVWQAKRPAAEGVARRKGAQSELL